ncbi:MAG: prephenate dehydratase [Solirubrobacteraceae bacterium]
MVVPERMRVAYFGPEGTWTQEALLAATAGRELDAVPYPTIYDTVMAVHFGAVERALVPIENSLEGSVNATLDALAMETENVAILGEVVHPIRHCLIARTPLELSEIDTVVSHPQATAQCARFIRARLPGAQVLAGSSTAEAVKTVAEHDGPWAALGNRVAAERYGCQVLRAGVEDVADNETRFVWLGPVGAPPGGVGRVGGSASGGSAGSAGSAGSVGTAASARSAGSAGSAGAPPLGPWKTAVVFWGVGSEAPGWLVHCLSEFATRDVNLTRIESRPRKQGLGRYMFFLDLEGRDIEPHVADALVGLRAHVEVLRVLGSFPAAIA